MKRALVATPVFRRQLLSGGLSSKPLLSVLDVVRAMTCASAQPGDEPNPGGSSYQQILSFAGHR